MAGFNIDDIWGAPQAIPRAAPPLPRRSWGDAVGDTGDAAAGGVGGLIQSAGTLYGLATGDMENGATDLGNSVQQYWQDRYSPQLKKKIADRKSKIDAADGVLGKAGTAVWETLSDPALAVDTAASNAATLIPGAVVGRGLAAAKYARGLAAGVEAGAPNIPGIAAAAGTFGTRAAIGTAAVQQGADVSQSAYEGAMKQPDEAWAQNSDFMNALRAEAARGGDVDALIPQLKRQFATSAARATFAPATVISVGANMIPGADLLERALVGGAARETVKAGVRFGLAKSVGKGLLGEASQEAVEEGGGQFAGNVARRAYTNPNQDLGEDVGENTGMGAAGGALFGMFGGAAHRKQVERGVPPPIPAEQGQAQDLLGSAPRYDNGLDYAPMSAAELANEKASNLPGELSRGAPRYGNEIDFDPSVGERGALFSENPPTTGLRTPELYTSPDPLQRRIDQNLGIDRQPVAGPGYAREFAAAADAPTGQVIADSGFNQIERPETSLEDVQRRAGILADEQRSAKLLAEQQTAVKAEKARVDEVNQRAAGFGLKGKNAQMLYDTLEQMRDAKHINAQEFVDQVNDLSLSSAGKVKKFIQERLTPQGATNAATTTDSGAAQPSAQVGPDAAAAPATGAPVAVPTAEGNKPKPVAANAGANPVVPSAAPVVAAKPVVVGTARGKGEVKTYQIAGKSLTTKPLHFERLKRVLGLDDDGQISPGGQMTLQAAGAAEAKPVGRDTVLKSIQQFLPPIKEVRDANGNITTAGRTTEQRITELLSGTSAVGDRGNLRDAEGAGVSNESEDDGAPASDPAAAEDTTPTVSDDLTYDGGENKNTGMRIAKSGAEERNSTGMSKQDIKRMDAYKAPGSPYEARAAQAKADVMNRSAKRAESTRIPVFSVEQQQAIVARNKATQQANWLRSVRAVMATSEGRGIAGMWDSMRSSGVSPFAALTTEQQYDWLLAAAEKLEETDNHNETQRLQRSFEQDGVGLAPARPEAPQAGAAGNATQNKAGERQAPSGDGGAPAQFSKGDQTSVTITGPDGNQLVLQDPGRALAVQGKKIDQLKALLKCLMGG